MVLLVRFNGVALITNVPIEETLEIIKNICQPPRYVTNLTPYCVNLYTRNNDKTKRMENLRVESAC